MVFECLQIESRMLNLLHGGVLERTRWHSLWKTAKDLLELGDKIFEYLT